MTDPNDIDREIARMKALADEAERRARTKGSNGAGAGRSGAEVLSIEKHERRVAWRMAGMTWEREEPPERAPPIGEPKSNGDWSKRPAPPRDNLLLSAWLTRKLPPRDFLLGNVFCTTSRWLIFGDTGIGKTLLALSIAGGMAAAKAFLGWEGKRRARIMYLDGEMPGETFKERMQLIADESGEDLALYGYNRDVLEPGEMPPLNTPEGEAWLLREIETVKPDAIVFDSIMSLLAGTMSEEESWTPVKLLMRKITSKRIGQIWLHHSNDTGRSFGTKTREWEMDTVVKLKTDDQAILWEFTKARLRTPQTLAQFKPRTIIRNEAGWSVVGEGRTEPPDKSDVEILKHAIMDAYDRLAGDVSTSPGFNGAPVRKVPADNVRDEVKRRGFLDVDDKGSITGPSRVLFMRARRALISGAKPRLIQDEDLIWR